MSGFPAQGSRQNLALPQSIAYNCPVPFFFKASVCGGGQPAPEWGFQCFPAHGAELPLCRDQPHRRKRGLRAARSQIPDSAVLIPVPRAFCCLVGTGLDWCLTYIHQPQHQASQNPLMMYHRPNMPLSYVALRVYLLLSQIEDQEPKEAEPEPQGEEGRLAGWVALCSPMGFGGHQGGILLAGGSEGICYVPRVDSRLRVPGLSTVCWQNGPPLHGKGCLGLGKSSSGAVVLILSCFCCRSHQ